MPISRPLSHIFIPLLVGAMIYLLFRPISLVFFSWLETLGFMPSVENTRLWAASFANDLPAWVIFSLPDALYTYALAAFVLLIWRRANLWLGVAVSIGILPEIGQGVGLVPGIFDPVDLGLKIIAFSTACLLLIKNQKYEAQTP